MKIAWRPANTLFDVSAAGLIEPACKLGPVDAQSHPTSKAHTLVLDHHKETGLPSLNERLRDLGSSRLLAMSRGIEKEGLRVQADGVLARTPHDPALGSALTHPHITTDFSESQLELVTGVHAGVQDCLDELTQIHQYVLRTIGPERMWACSMPGDLPPDAHIPIGQYGSSNVGQAKRVYRMGLSHRYGSRMQTISGIHYNWSLPGVSSEGYFGLIRNFRRHSFLLLMLFGASPAVTSSFAAGQSHALQALGDRTLFLPHATSLRMGRLGYQSDAQSALCVSYNDLDGYATSLHEALTEPYAPYEAMGVRAADGSYKQLGTSLLQIENEFYSTIRPKRVIRPGERPLHALRERGVEYVEVRCMDLNPLLPVGIDAHTMRVLDVFLLHALLSDSPADSPAEVKELASNQLLVASRGREPGLMLHRQGQAIGMQAWGNAVLRDAWPVAQALDAAHGDTAYTDAWQQATESFNRPSTLPSARVLHAMREAHAGDHAAFGLACSDAVRTSLLSQPWSDQAQQLAQSVAQASLREQAAIEAADTLPFEAFRQAYLDPAGLSVQPSAAKA